jgi:glucose-6-phosphate-specific signal transduction histidine kinase
MPVELRVDIERRLPESVEVAAYYVVAEALTNAVKHASASQVTVDVSADDKLLRLSVIDDGMGGAVPGGGSGLIGLKDRVEALGGHIHLTSRHRRGTTLAAEIPCAAGLPESISHQVGAGSGASQSTGGSTGAVGVPAASIASPAARQRSSR